MHSVLPSIIAAAGARIGAAATQVASAVDILCSAVAALTVSHTSTAKGVAVNTVFSTAACQNTIATVKVTVGTACNSVHFVIIQRTGYGLIFKVCLGQRDAVFLCQCQQRLFTLFLAGQGLCFQFLVIGNQVQEFLQVLTDSFFSFYLCSVISTQKSRQITVWQSWG